MRIQKRLRVNGIVQGVGFRPFVHRIAVANHLTGWVNNDSHGVLIEVQGELDDFHQFKSQLVHDIPAMAMISQVEEIQGHSEISFSEFKIIASEKNADTLTLIPPDAYVCDDCLRELFDPTDRRYHYPFINCTNCGPRFSIIKDMPYDRVQTTMSEFSMCSSCANEYSDPSDRRFHAQPNACDACGPKVWLCDEAGQKLNDEPIAQCCHLLRAGAIVAVKSVGGFHLCVNASDSQAVNRLRQRKQRGNKPFALMVRNIDVARQYCEISIDEERLLTSSKAPIVVLKKKSDCALSDAIAPLNPSLGIMLASSPVHHLLLDDGLLHTLVMTSANRRGQPIVYENQRAIDELQDIADAYLLHNRDIHTRVDDSVIKLTELEGLSAPVLSFIRRSRGYAPAPVMFQQALAPVIAAGSELKNTLALSKGHHVYLSQHIGDLKNDQVFDAHQECAKKLSSLLDIQPSAWAVDLHPQFRSTQFVEERSKLPIYKVQHHHAHMASCMAENQLSGPTIGIVFDGTGYGSDGTIWGGEFLLGDYVHAERVGTIKPFQLIGGDKAVEEPYRVAVSLLMETYGDSFLKLKLPLFDELSGQNIHVLQRMAKRYLNSFSTTSMGRLFDGISALLGIRSRIEYDAQAAIELEGLLGRDQTMVPCYDYQINQQGSLFVFDYHPMVRQIVCDIEQERRTVPDISRRFHSTLVTASCAMSSMISKYYGVSQVVLSGGVFMNEFMLSNLYRQLRLDGFDVYVHQQVPANDGGISLGQICIANAQLALTSQ
ncbi:MAG: Carbamoyltransferase HypF [Candidatus Celerinatantimonas neptuna]|nr:MAG: Carbamoyltransferase HypF [Candidatus Celerinatantimonas neptuna]